MIIAIFIISFLCFHISMGCFHSMNFELKRRGFGFQGCTSPVLIIFLISLALSTYSLYYILNYNWYITFLINLLFNMIFGQTIGTLFSLNIGFKNKPRLSLFELEEVRRPNHTLNIVVPFIIGLILFITGYILK